MSEEFSIRTIFVQIKCRLGTAYKVAEAISDQVPELSEIHSTSGSFDLLAKFYLERGKDPGLFISSVVQQIPDVVDTYTIIAFNAFTPHLDPA